MGKSLTKLIVALGDGQDIDTMAAADRNRRRGTAAQAVAYLEESYNTAPDLLLLGAVSGALFPSAAGGKAPVR